MVLISTQTPHVLSVDHFIADGDVMLAVGPFKDQNRALGERDRIPVMKKARRRRRMRSLKSHFFQAAIERRSTGWRCRAKRSVIGVLEAFFDKRRWYLASRAALANVLSHLIQPRGRLESRD